MSLKFAVHPKQKTYQNNQYTGMNGYNNGNSHRASASQSSNGSNGSNGSSASKTSTQYNIVPKKKKYAAKPLPASQRPRNQMSSGRVKTYGHKLSESMQQNSNQINAINAQRGHRKKPSNTPRKPTKRPVESLFDGHNKELLKLPFDVPDSTNKSELQQMHTQMRGLLDNDVTALEAFYDDQLKILDDLLATM